jgi:hypothetical protein
VNTVMKFSVSIKDGEFLDLTLSFSRRTAFHGISWLVKATNFAKYFT